MAESIEKTLNPKNLPLTEQQQDVVSVFDEVDQEMGRLDQLSRMISQHLSSVAEGNS